MQETSVLYKRLIVDPNHYVETRLTIGEDGVLVTKGGDRILFGTTPDSRGEQVKVLVASDGASSGYDESTLISMKTSGATFSDGVPSVGSCVSAELDVELYKPSGVIPRMARLVPYVRISNGKENSEWLQKGVYWIDTREEDASTDGENIKVTLHAYDSMLKAEADCPWGNIDYPALDITMVRTIADFLEVGIDARTYEIMTRKYTIPVIPAGYSAREILGYIASFYGGNFIMSDLGQLRLVRINEHPKESRRLHDGNGYTITFGIDPETKEDVRISV